MENQQPIKGTHGGKCNVTACTNTEPATWYNHSTRAYYCTECADRLNNDPYNKKDAMRLFGHDLLIQQPIKQKDLTLNDFLDEVIRENDFTQFYTWKQYKEFYPPNGNYEKHISEAAERYAAYREQQAKHAGFIEGCEAQKPVCAEYACLDCDCDSWESCHGKIDVASILEAPNAQSPYEPREKGGEDNV